MYGKISKMVIGLFSLLLALSFSVEAGYKSSYKSSYRSSYKSSSSYSKPSSSPSSSSSSKNNASSSNKTSAESTATGSGVKNEPSAASSPVAKKSISGAKLVENKGKIGTKENPAAFSARDNSSQKFSGTSGRSASYIGTKAPPEKVSSIIDERKRSGTDWTTLAMMYWMLSSSNSHASSLSSSDKAWIQQQIHEQESVGESREVALNELKSAGVDISDVQASDSPPVEFRYDMPKNLTAGVAWVFTVKATRSGETKAPECKLEGAEILTRGNTVFIKWKAPALAGESAELTCKAFGKEEVKTLVSV
ncbi:hypothetical protein P7V44_07115 [Providencia sp. CRE-3FA-0001]|uniref:Uncharacterized protein n=5 Tax=Enterobacterales TaxID=91347 RepID=A0A7L8KAJ8_ECOLX|nr:MULTISPECIES: hypothetical protein [Enterobacterales]ELY4881450.1 hypothetical protein [Morganella morganii]SUC33776.1 Uncharacterised protein [Providencia rustigianii]ELB1214807.1 hypothetical protein [Proteus mirabilis]ELR5094249.1 hypothetical protein [Providencia rettgeri]ELR5243097.1 hypothetical protein [Providencia rettgeri]